MAAVPCAVCRVLPLAGAASAFSLSGAACSAALAEWRWRVRGRLVLDGVGLVPWRRLRQHVFCVLQRRGCNCATSRRQTREHRQTARCPPRTKANAPAVLPQPPPSSSSLGCTRTQPHGSMRRTPTQSPESNGLGDHDHDHDHHDHDHVIFLFKQFFFLLQATNLYSSLLYLRMKLQVFCRQIKSMNQSEGCMRGHPSFFPSVLPHR